MSINTFLDPEIEIDKREVRLLGLAFLFLLAVSFSIAIAASVRENDWLISIESVRHFIILPVWAIGIFTIVRSLRRYFPSRDPYLLPVAALLSGWGMLTIWRLDPIFGARQLVWFLLALTLLFFILRTKPDLNWLREYRYLWLSAGVILLASTLIFGTNPSGAEPRLWLGCCGIYFQPSEPLRLLLIVFLASYFADRMVFRWIDKRPSLFSSLAPLLVVWAFSISFLFIQRDLGTMTLFIFLLAVLLYIASSRWEVLLAAGLFTLAGSAAGFFFLDIIRTRFDAWINPWLDSIGGSYQIVQSLIALAAGGIIGRGPGNGSPGIVPAAHTDFIFSAITEEWGMLGALGMIALFAIFVARGLKIASCLHSPFDKLLAAGIAVAIGLQTIMIIGGVIRFLPMTGITVPFVSYGGSSLITSFVALGLLLVLSNRASRIAESSRPLLVTQAFFSIAWASLAIMVAWWTIVRGPDLVARFDNPRRAIAERYSRRGSILDSRGEILAESDDIRGSYQRTVLSGSYSSVVGYHSAFYGQTGIEASMDDFLRGNTGFDPLQLATSTFLRGYPPYGLDVRLTLNAQLQISVAQLMQGSRGAVVVLDSMNGRILALVSSPSFDPNTLADDWETLIARQDAPLLNRASQSQYQPGMLLSPLLVALAADQELVDINAPSDIQLEPVIFQGQQFDCSQSPPLTKTATLGNAVRYGCPGPIVELAELLGGEWIQDALATLNFYQAVKIGIESTKPADLDPIQNGTAAQLAAIGQGDLTVTPLQVARAYAALFNQGILPVLELVRSYQNADGDWVALAGDESPHAILSAEATQIVVTAAKEHQELIRSFGYLASAGPIGGKIAWYLASDRQNRLVVIVLESDSIDRAETIGLAVLQHLNSPTAP